MKASKQSSNQCVRAKEFINEKKNEDEATSV
jgi:hypothetical protein